MLNDPDRDPIEVLAEEFLQQHRDGQAVTIQQFAAQHPEHAQDITDLFPMLVNLERLKEADENSHPRPATTGPIPHQTLGDFQILREIGRGGMGIVYLARQKSLGRSVALKVLSKSLSHSPQQVERFHQEAEAAARLHHTNIVPVYGVGQQDDTHYYAMQWIDGTGLDQIIAQLAEDPSQLPTDQQEQASQTRRRLSDSGNLSHHSFYRNAAQILVNIADALAYAHQHQVLHRDVKPSNILLDENSDAWITDFGLAKLADDRGLTQTGELIGTLRYMAPEQFEGKVDHRSDLYSLGLTLYELLTLQPAFNQSRHAELLSQRTRGSVAPPRSRNPQIPRDLETIVLTACADDPNHRYQSAGQMRDDLQRFLEGRPIQARRIHAVERLWRWCRRNPAIAAVSSLAAILLVTVAIVSATAYFQTREALRKEKLATDQARESQIQAERDKELAKDNLRRAVAAFDSIFDHVTRRGIPQSLSFEYGEADQSSIQTALTADDVNLLKQLLPFYQKFGEQNANDLQLQYKILQARYRIGAIQARLGDYAESDQSLTSALQLADDFLQQQPGDPDAMALKFQILNDQGELAYYDKQRRRDPGPGFALHQQVIAEIQSLPADTRQSAPIQFQLARAYDLMGSTMFRSQLYAGIVDSQNRPNGPPGQRRPPRDRDPQDPQGAGERGPRERELRFPPFRIPGFPPPENGPARPLAGPGKGPLPDIETAIEILQQLVQQHPEQRDYVSLLAKAMQHRYVFLLNHHDRAEATIAFQQAETQIRRCIELQPDNPQLLLDLADHLSTANDRGTEMSPETVQEKIAQSIQLCQDLCQQFPNAKDYQALLASAHRNLAGALRSSSSPEQRQLIPDHLTQARDILQKLVDQHPSKYQVWSLALTLVEQAQWELDQTQLSPDAFPRMERDLQQSIQLCQQAEKPLSETGQHVIAQAWQELSRLYHRNQQPEKARAAQQQSRDAQPRGFRLPDLFRGGPRREPRPPAPPNPPTDQS